MAHEVKPLFGNTVKSVTPKASVGHSIFKNSIPATPKAPQVAGKIILAGAKIRQRIQLNIEDLKKYSTNSAAIKAAHQQIISTNQEEINLKFVLNWGSEIQEEHNKLLESFFSIVNGESIRAAKQRIGQIVDLLNDFQFKKSGWLQSQESFLEKNKTKIAYVKQLAFELKGLEERIFKIHEGAKAITLVIEELKNKIESYIITCMFFSEYTENNFPNELYISRLSSLLATRTAFETDTISNNSFMASIISLIEIIRNVVGTEITVWLSNYLNFLTTDEHEDTLTLEQQKQTLLQKLKI